MNLFSGMTNAQFWSAIAMIGIFTVYAVLTAVAMASFYITSRPRRGRVRASAAWQLAALFFLFWANVAMVWAAPAEDTFVTPGGGVFDFGYGRSLSVLASAIFALLGLVCMVAGWLGSAASNRAESDAALAV